jgi:F-type H+-transporting ATPase subunit b
VSSRLAAIAVLALALPASAASEGDHGGGATAFLWQVANLALLVGVLVYFTRRPIRDFLARRRAGVQQDLESSARLLAEAEARLAEWKARAARLDAELAEIRESTRRLAEQERDAILAHARDAAERSRRDATAAVDRELQRARAALSAEAAQLAVDLAGRLLREQVTEDDEQRLFDELLAQLDADRPRAGDGR